MNSCLGMDCLIKNDIQWKFGQDGLAWSVCIPAHSAVAYKRVGDSCESTNIHALSVILCI